MMVLSHNQSVLMEGADISYFQGNIDAKKMYDAGIRLVIIRAGFGRTIDKNFVSYINALYKAGIRIGVYWFIYASTIYEARLNAEKCLDVIRPYKDMITCGVWADWEYDSDKVAGNKLTVSTRCNIVKEFLMAIELEGYIAGIYSNEDYIKNGKFSKELIAEYPLWFAKYAGAAGDYAKKGLGNFPYLWQYTSSGKGSQYGVSSKCIDLDHVYFYDSEYVANQETVTDKVQKDIGAVKSFDNPYPVPKRTIFYSQNSYIMHGDDVKYWQWHLWRFGLFLDENGNPDATQIDGYWGPDSNKAALEAKRRLGLPLNNKMDIAVRIVFESV